MALADFGLYPMLPGVMVYQNANSVTPDHQTTRPPDHQVQTNTGASRQAAEQDLVHSRSDDTDACHSQGARNRQGASQAGSCQTANDGSDKSGMGVPRSIETRNKTHACMALRRNETKKNTVLRIRMGRDQGRGRCLVALA